jgi:uncharacterized protein
MLPAPLPVTADLARRFHRRAVLLDTLAPAITPVLQHHGYVQIDPINICGRVHDHILRNRVAGYREGDLMRHLHGAKGTLTAAERTAFEHHLPDNNVLVAFPLDAWPHLLAAMNRRTRRHSAWSGKLTKREKELAERILGEIATRGPLSSGHIDDDRRSRQMIWGSFSLAKATLQKLFFHGRLLIARRENNRRLYDLPERVLPAAVLAAREPGPAETARWVAHLKLRQRRLVTLKREELPLVADLIQPIKIEGCPLLYCLRTDVPIFDQVGSRPAVDLTDGRARTPLRAGHTRGSEIITNIPGGERSRRPTVGTISGEFENYLSPRLLAPLDPLIYDRRVTQQLWGFDYTWEVYTPAHKRERGYYALPVLAGTELVGHVDPKADRAASKLQVVSRRVRRGHQVAPAIRELAAFLGLRA